MEKISESRVFDGRLERYKHPASSTSCDMTFSVFLPPAAESKDVPVLYWLSGLTCTDENFMVKSGAQRMASELGLAIVAPDTSPRGCEIPGEDDDWDFGSGAGFYVNATEDPWRANYRMYDYVVSELPQLVEKSFPFREDCRSVSGHSMGGHGALIVALKNPGFYKSVSAFAPISHPTQCPWGQKAFGNYLGSDQTGWAAYDAVELLRKCEKAPHLLVEQGGADAFLDEQLGIPALQAVCKERGHSLDLRIREGYDHGFYFVGTFLGEHLKYHSDHLEG